MRQSGLEVGRFQLNFVAITYMERSTGKSKKKKPTCKRAIHQCIPLRREELLKSVLVAWYHLGILLLVATKVFSIHWFLFSELAVSLHFQKTGWGLVSGQQRKDRGNWLDNVSDDSLSCW